MSDIGLTVQSPAKINWSLRVLGRREDGFHDIESLVSAVTLHDEMEFADGADGTCVIACDHPGVPMGRRNLIWRAARLLAVEAGRRTGVTCRLVKRIPVGGGLGGGSSNGAAALRALNERWGLHWPITRLHALASALGSDVPFLLHGGSAVITGRGEHVQPVRLAWQGWIVLLLPGIPMSTAEVYRRWKPGRGDLSEAVPVVAEPTDAVAWMRRTFNMLEAPAFEVCPRLREWQERGSELAGRPVRLSGSGSTMFTAFDTLPGAQSFAERAGRELGIETRIVQPAERGPLGNTGCRGEGFDKANLPGSDFSRDGQSPAWTIKIGGGIHGDQ